MLAVYKKEMHGYFTSMTGYVFIGLFVLIAAIFYADINILGASPYFDSVLYQLTLVLVFLVPALTVRLLSDERRHKTDQLLYTVPVKIHKIVLAKYFAALTVYAMALLITVSFPLMMMPFGEIGTGKMISAYFGIMLLGSLFIAVGMFVSGLTDNQMVAALGTFAALFLMYIMRAVASISPIDRTSSIVFVCGLIVALSSLLFVRTRKKSLAAVLFGALSALAFIAFLFNNAIYDGFIIRTFNYLSVMHRFYSFYMGILTLADVVYFITFIVAFMYLTVNSIEKRRWS